MQGAKKVVICGFLLVAVFNLQSCRKKDTPTYECTPDITVLLPEKAVSMFCFKEGSYWIYQREDSLYTDSVWVTETRQGTYPVDKKVYNYFNGQKCYESRITYFNSRDAYFFTSNKFGLQNRAPKNTSSYSEELFVLYDGWQKTSDIRLGFVGNKMEKINAYGDTVYHIDSIEVLGLRYYDVTIYKQKVQKPDYLKEAFYAPNIGMIRFKDIHDAWWDLIRYNIIQ